MLIVALDSGWEFVIPGYLAVFGGLSAYSIWTLRRARRIGNQLPEEKRRFIE